MILRKITLIIIVLLLVLSNSLPVQAFPDFFSDSEIQFIDPNICDPTDQGGAGDDDTDETPGGSGKWSLGPGANRAGVDLTPLFKKFLDKLATYTSYEPIVTTGTNHAQYSASGLISDHWAGSAADFGSAANKFGTDNAQPGQAVPRGDEIAAAAFKAAGMSSGQAKAKAKQGGAIKYNGTLDGKSIRVQVIWKSGVGGNHHDHVHVGIKDLGTAFNSRSTDKKSGIIESIIESVNLLPTASAVSAEPPPTAEEDAHEVDGSDLIYMVGDSIAFGAREELKNQFKDADLDLAISARISRSLSSPGKPGDANGTPGSYHTGLDQLDVSRNRVKNSGAIIMSLGTNKEISGTFENNVRKAVSRIKSANAKIKIYWVNVFSKVSHKGDYNTTLNELSSELSFTVIDTVNADIEFGDPQEIHPSAKGNQTFAETVLESIEKNGTAETDESNPQPKLPSGCCPVSSGNEEIKPIEGGNFTGSTDVEKVYNHLIGLGLKPVAAAGVVGNLVYESGGSTPQSQQLNPKADNGNHKGIAQWDTTDRWPKMIKFAKDKLGSEYKAGESEYDMKTQTEFIIHELDGPRFKSVRTKVEAAATPSQAAHIINAEYEITGLQEGRKQAAEYNYRKYGQGGGKGSPTQPEAGGGGGATACVCTNPDADIGSPGSNPKTLAEFITKYADAALAAAKSQGIPYDAMLAQIAHESGLPLSLLASKYNNFGGIKYTGPPQKPTPPLRNGVEGGTSRYVWFASPQEGLTEQAKFYRKNSRYQEALKYPKDPERFIQEVAKAGYAEDPQYATKVLAKLKEVQAELVKQGKPLSKDVEPEVEPPGDGEETPTVSGCTGGGGGSGKVIDGFSFPVGNLKQSEVGANQKLPCNKPEGCHHDGTSAFDLGRAGENGILGSKSEGLPVFAIEDGTIVKYSPTYNGIQGCPSYQLKGKSGWVYWYGHTAKATIKTGSKVEAGKQIAEIGSSKCTGAGPTNPPHLHIDRGTPKGANGGSAGARDPSINEVINKLWEALPD